MAWSLAVSGDVRAERGSAAHAVEEQLAAELNAVLSKPEYGVLTTYFRGNHVVTTHLHVPVPVEAEPTLEPEPVVAPKITRGAKPVRGE